MDLQIGDLAREAAVPISTIRYYERIGLLTPTRRSAGGYRLYQAFAVDEVRFIRRAQALGFTLPEIAGLLDLSRKGIAPCADLTALARKHLAALDQRLQRLTAFRELLRHAVESWEEGNCGYSAKGLCSLIDVAEA